MDWTTIITSFITACIPAVISYFLSIQKSKSELNLFKLQSEAELTKLKAEHEVEIEKLKTQSDIDDKKLVNTMAMSIIGDMLTGNINIEDFQKIDNTFNKMKN